MAKKKITLDDGSKFTLRGGKLYQAISGAEYSELVKSGKLKTKSGKLIVAPSENAAREAAKDADYVVEINASKIDHASREPDAPAGRTLLNIKKSIPISKVKVKSNDGKFKSFIKPQGAEEYEVKEVNIKGVGLNGRNIGNEKDLRAIYQKAADDLFTIIQKADARLPFAQYRNKQLTEINKVLKDLNGKVRTFTQEEMGSVVRAGFNDAGRKIASLSEDQFTFKFSGINKQAVAVLTEKAYTDFANTVVGMGTDAQRAVMNKYAIQNEIVAGAIQGSSFSRTTRDVLNELKAQGFKVLIGRSGFGRRMNLASYSNMLVRSQNILSYNEGARDRMMSAGRRFGIFPTIRPDIDGSDICNVWERKKIVDLVKDPLPPASTHPNCRHTVQPISFERLRSEFPNHYARAIGFYNEAKK